MSDMLTDYLALAIDEIDPEQTGDLAGVYETMEYICTVIDALDGNGDYDTESLPKIVRESFDDTVRTLLLAYDKMAEAMSHCSAAAAALERELNALQNSSIDLDLRDRC